jgi:hypothetical protein
MFLSRDEVDEAAWLGMTSVQAFGLGSLKGWPTRVQGLDQNARRTFVALTWPETFERPSTWRVVGARKPQEVGQDVLANFVAIAARWWAR